MAQHTIQISCIKIVYSASLSIAQHTIQIGCVRIASLLPPSPLQPLYRLFYSPMLIRHYTKASTLEYWTSPLLGTTCLMKKLNRVIQCISLEVFYIYTKLYSIVFQKIEKIFSSCKTVLFYQMFRLAFYHWYRISFLTNLINHRWDNRTTLGACARRMSCNQGC